MKKSVIALIACLYAAGVACLVVAAGLEYGARGALCSLGASLILPIFVIGVASAGTSCE